MGGGAIGTLLGGIGLFLLGMGLMTDSLAELGGRTLRGLLARLTRNRAYAVLTGAVVTATVQSSSATTLVTIGFVSAGLITFSQSIGLILGANLGTTSTAWIVSLVGLEMQVSTVALPLVGIGALLRLTTRGRRARLALAMSGFGLVFVGIDVMQSGMAASKIDLTSYGGADGLPGTLLLVGLGVVTTVFLQSSSAAVATTLVALHGGGIDIVQAAALVIGQNVGTTVTAVLGAIGGTVAARRAAVAHTLFNVVTAVVAIVVLHPFLALITSIARRFVDDSPETVVALFHTAFNLLGVLLIFPVSDRFARLVERLVRERGIPAVERLSNTALHVPALALEAARRSAAETATTAVRQAVEALRSVTVPQKDEELLRRALRVLSDPRAILEGDDEATRALAERLRATRNAADAVATYLGKIRTSHESTALRDEHLELLQAMDHIRRLVHAAKDVDALDVVRDDPRLRHLAAELVADLDPVLKHLSDSPDLDELSTAATAFATAVEAEKARRDAYRTIVLARLADGDVTPSDAEVLLRTSRWMGKIPSHAARAFLHLSWVEGSPSTAPEGED